ncbi:aldose 1-epimerase family protein [Enterococcus sp. LJL128]|uniref:aldose 1-epimerase family protein n=1 Tax=Enterococcus sp. LJL51 TaxID=3416656 RepID=UPI003CF84108
MTIVIENEKLKATIAEAGAELVSLQSKETNTEYIWQADPAFWGRHAPVLFPFVGRLKDDRYTYQNKVYPMGQHGFARDKDFEVLEQGDGLVSLSLKSNDETRKVYPFDFELVITYELEDKGIKVSYQVENTGKEEMLFSVGGHPAFNVPLEKDLDLTDYYFSLEPNEDRIQIPLSGPYLDLENKTLGQTSAAFDLSRELFVNDALIFETPGANKVIIQSDKGERGISLSYTNMPFVGIWSPYATEAPFVCIEPWCGIADTVESNGQLIDKFGINRLAANKLFKTDYTIGVK